MVQDYKSHNVNANKLFTEFLIYIKCGKDEYLVGGSTFGNPISIFNVPIVSIVKKNENGEYLDSNIKYLVNKDVKEMLGLKDDVTTVKVDSISNKPFKAETLEQPKLNTTTTQQTVNNDSNKEVAAEEHASSSTTTDQTPEQSTSGSIGRIEINGEKLKLVVSKDKEDFMQESKNPENPNEYLVYIECAKGTHRITGSRLEYVSASNENELISFSINSVANEDGKDASGELVEMKKMLGLNENKKSIEITKISETLNQSNTNTIGNDATQQEVNNKRETTESEEFFDTGDDGVTQPSSSMNESVEEKCGISNPGVVN